MKQLSAIIENLRDLVTLMATYLIWLAIKPKPTCDFMIYGGITNSFAIFTVRMLQKLFFLWSFRLFHHIWYCLLTLYIDNPSSFISCNTSFIVLAVYVLYVL